MKNLVNNQLNKTLAPYKGNLPKEKLEAIHR